MSELSCWRTGQAPARNILTSIRPLKTRICRSSSSQLHKNLVHIERAWNLLRAGSSATCFFSGGFRHLFRSWSNLRIEEGFQLYLDAEAFFLTDHYRVNSNIGISELYFTKQENTFIKHTFPDLT